MPGVPNDVAALLIAAAVFLTPTSARAQAAPPPATVRASSAGPPVPSAAAAASGPRVITYLEEGDPVPPGYHRSSRIRKEPVILGAALFGVAYLLSTLVVALGVNNWAWTTPCWQIGQSICSNDSQAPNNPPPVALFIPVFGPFVQMASTTSATQNWALAVDGLAQSAGLALLIHGLASPKPVLERDRFAVRVVPQVLPVGRAGGGLGLAGVF
jgi:hypothetical protein